MHPPMAFTVVATVDGFDSPGRLRGWAIQRHGGKIVEPPVIVVRRGLDTISVTGMTRVRPDVAGSDQPLAGWAIELLDENDIKDLIAGRLDICVEGNAGTHAPVRYWPGFAKCLDRFRLQRLLASADLAGLAEALKEIEKSKSLTADISQAVRRCRALLEGLHRPSLQLPMEKPEDLSPIWLPLGTPSSDQSAVLGKDGYLFLTEGSNNVLARYNEHGHSIERLAEQWVDLFRRRKRIVEDAGGRYFQLIVPEKITVVPELFPEPLSVPTPLLRRVEELLESDPSMSPSYISITKLFWQNRLRSVSRTDSHPSAFGAYSIISAVAAASGLEELSEQNFKKTVLKNGDLGFRFLGIPLGDMTDEPIADNFRDPELVEAIYPSQGNTGTHMKWKNDVSLYDRKLIAFGNSCFERGRRSMGMSWWAARLFRHFDFHWTGSFSVSAVLASEADIVICQTVERFLFVAPPES